VLICAFKAKFGREVNNFIRPHILYASFVSRHIRCVCNSKSQNIVNDVKGDGETLCNSRSTFGESSLPCFKNLGLWTKFGDFGGFVYAI